MSMKSSAMLPVFKMRERNGEQSVVKKRGVGALWRRVLLRKFSNKDKRDLNVESTTSFSSSDDEYSFDYRIREVSKGGQSEQAIAVTTIPTKGKDETKPRPTRPVHECISDAIYHSFQIYNLAEIRDHVRKGRLSVSNDVLMAPNLSQDCLLQACHAADEHLEAFNTKLALETRSACAWARNRGHQGGWIAAIQDDSDAQAVYYVQIDDSAKSITIVFRGCHSLHDWKENFTRTYMKSVANPFAEGPNDSPLGLFSGHYDYLFGSNSTSSAKFANRFEELLSTIKNMIQQHPDYTLYATGHSMGGSLATLFSFFAIAQCKDWDMPRVHCITFGSPRMGNGAFFQAFQRLEAHGRISLLRMVNHEDIIPTLPDLVSAPTWQHHQGVYHHVGIEVRCFSTLWSSSSGVSSRARRFSTYHSHQTKEFWAQACKDFLKIFLRLYMFLWIVASTLFLGKNTLKEWPHMHHCMEYMLRVKREQDTALSSLTWDEFVQKSSSALPSKMGRVDGHAVVKVEALSQ